MERRRGVTRLRGRVSTYANAGGGQTGQMGLKTRENLKMEGKKIENGDNKSGAD